MAHRAGFKGDVWYERRSLFHYASNLPRDPSQLMKGI